MLLAAQSSLAFGCSEAPSAVEHSEGGRGRDAAPPRDVAKDVVLPPCEPTFASIQKNVFDVACSEGTCHGPPTPAWNLLLTDGPEAEARLVGQVAASCTEFFRVVKGRPSESFLWLKVSSDRPPCGDRMPFGGPPLPEWSLACIRGWISALAVPPDASADSAARD